MRVLMKMTAMLGLALAAQVVAPVAASAAPVAAGVSIASRWDGRCLDVDNRTPPHNGSIVHIWDCHGGTNQNWIYNGTSHTIRSSLDDRCLDIDTSTPVVNGRKVQMWGCNGRLNQKWTIGANGRIKSHYGDWCLDLRVVGDPPTQNGSKVQVWACNGQLNQRWEHHPS